MKLVGLMMAKNEEWILNYSLPIAMQWLDEIVILDHNSSDNTPTILHQAATYYPGRVHLLHSAAADWPEMRLRQQTLDKGRQVGGTHFAIVDCDESITKSILPIVREVFDGLAPGVGVSIPMIAAWRSIRQYRTDRCVWSKGWLSLGWRDTPSAFWSDNNGYHLHARMPKGVNGMWLPLPLEAGGAIHFEFADHERLKWKHRWYKLHEAVVYPEKTISSIDTNYNQALNEKGLELTPMPVNWRWLDSEYQIRVGTTPWHAEACIDLYHKAASMNRTHGLNLWGWSA